MQFTIRDALPSDSAGLIALTSLAPMEGKIGLRIDRKLDYFNTCFKNFSYSPYEILPAELNDYIHFISANEKNIDAAIAAFDPFANKQNVVTHYSFSIAVLLAGLYVIGKRKYQSKAACFHFFFCNVIDHCRISFKYTITGYY
ncbi:MAG: hypothetical protein ABI653_06270 [Bacteroidota bacterium]